MSYGSKEAAGEAARQVIAESIARPQAGTPGQGRSGSDARKREQMGFG